jgi:BlaI family penicillinase repressor
MKKNNYPQPSEAELAILQVLWGDEPTTVREVYEKLCKSRDVGYTTILKQMQRMFEKGMVTRIKEGKTHFYKSVPKEKDIQTGMLSKMVKTAFKGSKMALVLHVLGDTKTSSEELKVLQEWLQQQKINN